MPNEVDRVTCGPVAQATSPLATATHVTGSTFPSNLYRFPNLIKKRIQRNIMSNDIKAVIWDLDGVIIDSAQEHLRSWQQLAQETGITFTEQDFRATFGRRNNDIIPQHWQVHTPEEIQRLADRKEVLFREFIKQGIEPLSGAIELMRELYEYGYLEALASSAPLANISLVDELLGLNRYLSRLVSGETVARGKPAPDVFLKAAKELDVDPGRCLVIEDAVAGLQAAHAAGMRCIAVLGDRDIEDVSALKEAELLTRHLTEVSVHTITTLP